MQKLALIFGAKLHIDQGPDWQALQELTFQRGFDNGYEKGYLQGFEQGAVRAREDYFGTIKTIPIRRG